MLRSLWNNLRKQEGFTLLEVLVVIAVMGIIAAIITPRFLGVMRDARVDTAKAGAKEIQLGLSRYEFKNSVYPRASTTTNPAAETGDEATFHDTITDYASMLSVLGSSVNLPPAAGSAAAGYTAPTNSPIRFGRYITTDGTPNDLTHYTLDIIVNNGQAADGAERCIQITETGIDQGHWDDTNDVCVVP